MPRLPSDDVSNDDARKHGEDDVGDVGDDAGDRVASVSLTEMD